MQEWDDVHKRIQEFEKIVNEHKELDVHIDNKFNKQFSVLLKDWSYISIITERIKKGDSHNATELGLDLKSLYVFGKVFSESLLYIASLFIKSPPKVEWSKIGPFIKTVKENLGSEKELNDFWVNCQDSVEALCERFKYRNFVLHHKDSTTEWTMAWPGRSNLEHVSIQNVPWKEDAGKKEAGTLNTINIIKELSSHSINIINYIESTYVK